MSIQPINIYNQKNYTNFTSNNNPNKKQSVKTQLGIAATSALGVASAVALVAKRQGFSLKLSSIKKHQSKIGLYSKLLIRTDLRRRL